jgi:DUF1365 family protein
MNGAAPALYDCRVMHRRFEPMQYHFSYRVFNLLVDIDDLPRLNLYSRLISHNRFNLFSFHDRDHGPRDGGNLRRWIDRCLSEAGVDRPAATVTLASFPRVLGYTFNPLSLWYCYDGLNQLIAVLCEVNNTFGESHSYLLHEHGKPLSLPVRATKKKCFHVSPFMDMGMQYHFTLRDPGPAFYTLIHEYQGTELVLVASQDGQRRALNSGNLLRMFFRYPLVTLQVIGLIHWQALRIWIRGGRYHPKPMPPKQEIS